MKVIPLRDAKQGLSATVDDAQKQRVLITRHGRPAAVVIGVEGHSMEDVLLMQNPAFWRLIEARRKEPAALTLEEVRKRFGGAGSGRQVGPKRRKRR